MGKCKDLSEFDKGQIVMARRLDLSISKTAALVGCSCSAVWMGACASLMAPGCTMGRRQAGGGSVMLWAMFCWETLGPAIHVDVTLTRITFLSIVADHVHSFMETIFPVGCGLFQQDNAPCHKAKKELGM
ncbi:hypothetical protein QTP86_027744, partial [Hemibagrus guttatus]